MDVRVADENAQLRETIDRALSRMNTCLPGIIESFDAGTQTASILPAIKMRTFIDETINHIDLPLLVNVPVVFPKAGGFAITFPVIKGDECLIVFSQRAIDNWHEQGGVQPPDSNAIGCRHHDLTDAFAILAPSSIPEVLSSFCTDGVEMRNKDASVKITLKNSGIFIVGDIHQTGNFTASGNVSDGTRTIAGDRTIYNSHTHPEHDGGNTNAPTQQE